MILALLALGAAQTFAQGVTVYDNIPNPLPGNLSSQPFQAQQAEEFGDRVGFATATGELLTAVQTMSSWGCQSGAWFSSDCVSAPGATFSHPITLNIYAVGAGNSVGPLLGSVTQTFAHPYRPSADPACTGGRWLDAASNTCFNGYAYNITFDLSGLNLPATGQVIYSIAYNTSNYGDPPIGNQPCSATAAGCPYDSLNVALADPAIYNSVGTNPAPADAYFDTLTSAWYCDGGAGGVGFFRLDAGCWTGFKPAVRFTAANTPGSANDCKKDGWKTRTTASGQSFPNQGQCIQYFNNGK
jgi:hypothetical protein